MLEAGQKIRQAGVLLQCSTSVVPVASSAYILFFSVQYKERMTQAEFHR